MREPTYRQALKVSWSLAWNHKILWIFGLFAAFWGQLGLMDLLSKFYLSPSYLGFSPVWWMTPRVWFDTSIYSQLNMNASGWVWLLWLLIILLGFLVLFIFMATVSQGAIIKAASKIVKKNDLPDLEKSWQAGTKHFWSLFFLNTIKKIILVSFGCFLGTLSILLVFNNSGLGIFLFILLFILLACVGIIISFISIYAACFIVIKDYKLFKSISSAWKLFTKHWIVSLEVGLIVMLLNIVLAVVSIAGLFLILFPSLLFWLGAVLLYNPLLIFIGTLIGLVLFILFIFLIISVFSVFNISIWTYLFTKMHREGIVSRIVQFLTR